MTALERLKETIGRDVTDVMNQLENANSMHDLILICELMQACGAKFEAIIDVSEERSIIDEDALMG